MVLRACVLTKKLLGCGVVIHTTTLTLAAKELLQRVLAQFLTQKYLDVGEGEHVAYQLHK